MRLTTAIALGISLSLLVTVSCAQAVAPLSEIRVTVVDQTGAVLPDSEVTFKGDSKTIVSHTGNVGSVTIGLPSGHYAVSISHYGFLQSEVRDFKVVTPATSELRVVLWVDPNNSYVCGPCGCDRCTGVVVPATTSDPPNAIRPEPSRAPVAPALTSQRVTKKIRSWHCLYLWKCSANTSN